MDDIHTQSGFVLNSIKWEKTTECEWEYTRKTAYHSGTAHDQNSERNRDIGRECVTQ